MVNMRQAAAMKAAAVRKMEEANDFMVTSVLLLKTIVNWKSVENAVAARPAVPRRQSPLVSLA